MRQVIHTGSTSDGYEYYAEFEGNSTGPVRTFRVKTKTGEIEEIIKQPSVDTVSGTF